MTKRFRNITQFTNEVSKQEGKKREVNIAQIREVMRVANDLLDGQLYNLIRRIQ